MGITSNTASSRSYRFQHVQQPPLLEFASYSLHAVNTILVGVVSVYGGAYIFGDGYDSGRYNGTNLALSQNVIVVTINYRLQVFGFLALDELAKESGAWLQRPRVCLSADATNTSCLPAAPLQCVFRWYDRKLRCPRPAVCYVYEK